MKKGLLFLLLFAVSGRLLAQNEVGPEGHKLIWGILIIIAGAIIFFLLNKKIINLRPGKNRPLIRRRKLELTLDKDRLYYPDILTLSIKNTGNIYVDIDQPVLIFDNFWLKRKFKIKGKDGYHFYPLYLETGKTHTLEIDLNRFYGHDKQLKRFPKVTVAVFDVKKHKYGSQSLYLRKTLFKY